MKKEGIFEMIKDLKNRDIQESEDQVIISGNLGSNSIDIQLNMRGAGLVDYLNGYLPGVSLSVKVNGSRAFYTTGLGLDEARDLGQLIRRLKENQVSEEGKKAYEAIKQYFE